LALNPVAPADPPPVELEAARAEWGGEHMSPDDMMWALADAYFPPSPGRPRELGET